MYDILIIGGGPAALSAGIYAVRAGHKTAVFEKLFAGGQAAKAFEVNNYPGFGNINGGELAMKMSKHATDCGCDIIYEEVTLLDINSDVKTVRTNSSEYKAKCVILAMGAKPKTLGIEDAYIGSGVSYCAACDGALFRGKVAAVIGGGNTAVGDALYLSNLCEKVYLIQRRDSLRADNALQTRLFENKKIEVFWNKALKKITGEGRVDGIIMEDTQSGEEQKLNVNGVFIAVGQSPQTELVIDKLNCTDEGYIITDRFMQTSVNGVFAAGDVRETPLRQIVTAVADGAIAVGGASTFLSLTQK